jgi:hypothetical protein
MLTDLLLNPILRVNLAVAYLLTLFGSGLWKMADMNDECHNFMLCLTIHWTMIKKGILFANRPSGRQLINGQIK